MKPRTSLQLTTAAAAILLGLAAGPASATSPQHHDDPARHQSGAVFVQTDGSAGNAVVAYQRLGDGTLRQRAVYPTGGLGLQLTGSVVDHLASQSSLIRHHNRLFAVNAGSNTVTVFAMRGARLARTQVIGSGGQAPVSIAADGNRVFVLNARGGGSIQGYRLTHGRLEAVAGWHRDLGLDPNGTPEFTHTPAQIAFTPDGSKLVITTKAATSAFDVFTLEHSRLSAAPVVTTVAGAVPFGFQFDGAGRLIASEAGTNSVASYTVRRDGTLTRLAAQATGQQATCWTVVAGRYAYVSNAGSGSLSGYRLGGGGSLTALGNTATDAGTVDAAATPDGRYLYVQTGAEGHVNEFRIGRDGTLTRIGTVTVPGAVGAEGIVAD